jgi:hypothetical protein
MGKLEARCGALAPCAALRRVRLGALLAVALGLAVAGCTTASEQVPAAYASVGGPTIAFESIDGPPESIFRKYVQNVSDEANARQMAIVSREAPAQFRVRGYLATLVEKRRGTVIAWVWDVYDINQQRTIRLSGEEKTSGAGRGTWAAADDSLLRRIAKNGIDQLAAFLGAPGAPNGPSGPGSAGPSVAAADDAAAQPNGAALAFSTNSR